MRSSYIRTIVLFILICIFTVGCGNKETDYSISSVQVSVKSIYGDVNSEKEADEQVQEEALTESVAEESITAQAAETDCVAIKDAKIGDCVLFGNYEQDGDTANGAEAIEWIVLAKEDDTILLLSKYVIDKKAFNEKEEQKDDTANTDKKTNKKTIKKTNKKVKTPGWTQSSIRVWLNEEFVTKAFNNKEIEQIVETEIENPGSITYFKEFGKKSGSALAKKTLDKVFLLSYQEVLDYFEPVKVDKLGIYVDKKMITTATAATAIDNKEMSKMEYETFYKDKNWPEDCVEIKGAGWYLRTSGLNTDDVMSVGYDGAMRGQYLEYGGDYESDTFEGGIRPAIWVKR